MESAQDQSCRAPVKPPAASLQLKLAEKITTT